MAKHRLFIILISVCFLLTSCNVLSSSSPPLFGVIYTNASAPDSSFVLFDSKGEITFQEDLPAMGIFQLAKDNKGNILLPVQYEDKVYSFSLASKQHTETKSLPFPIYLNQVDHFRITTYNSGLHSGTVQWNEQKKIMSTIVKGFPRIATFDQTYLYVFATIIDQKKALLYLIKRNTGKIEAEIPLQTDQANDIQIIDEHVIITSTTNQKQIALFDRKTKHVQYLTLPHARPEYVIPFSNTILITYQGSSIITQMDRKSKTIIGQIQLPQPVFKVKQKDNRLYVLSQIPANGQGLIGVYDIENWKLQKKYLLPSIRDTTVQDLIIF
ncbi:hypothetical protein [Shimazuella kribbensis]|uniref:hypothetical protein n=1 Tax=Shimazuella kribbensis TaxID=139808 RepID=UPI000422AF9F|nr:hypothetical protein [Shimazuella kribbensis]